MTTIATLPSAADLDAVAAEAEIKQATTPPTPVEIDYAIARYEVAQAISRAADKGLEQEKAALILMVDKYGHQPKDAGQSKRLAGLHNEATITWSTSFAVIEGAVDQLREYLFEQRLTGIFGRFFVAVIKHKMVDGARDVLKTLDLPNRIREKIASLVGLAIDIKTSTPSLKVKTITPEKPKRTKKAKVA